MTSDTTLGSVRCVSDGTVWPAIVALADPTAVASMSPARVAELRACAGRTTALMGTMH